MPTQGVKSKKSIADDISAMLEREVGFMGPLIFKKQCKELNVEPAAIKSGELKAISIRVAKAIAPITGEPKADAIQRGMMDYSKALDTLSSPARDDAAGDEAIEAELTVAENKLSIGDLTEAAKAARRSLAALQASKGDLRRRMGPRVVRTLAKVLSGKKEWRAEAIQRYNEALELAKSAGDRYEEALAYNGLGMIAWRAADHRLALARHEEALRAIKSIQVVSKAEKTRVSTARMRIEMGLGNVYLDLIDFQAAIEHDKKAIEIGKSMECWVDVGLIYNNMARVYEEMRDYRSAVEIYERGIEYLHKGKGTKMEGWTMTNMASTLVEMGRVKEAKPYLDKAEKLIADFSDPIAHSKLNCMWGKYHRARKEWGPGIERFKRSIAVIEHENSPDYLATAQEEFGTLYLEKGDAEKAQELLKAALDWQKKKGDMYRTEKISQQLSRIK